MLHVFLCSPSFRKEFHIILRSEFFIVFPASGVSGDRTSLLTERVKEN